MKRGGPLDTLEGRERLDVIAGSVSDGGIPAPGLYQPMPDAVVGGGLRVVDEAGLVTVGCKGAAGTACEAERRMAGPDDVEARAAAAAGAEPFIGVGRDPRIIMAVFQFVIG